MDFIISSVSVVKVTSVGYNTSDKFGSKLVENNTNANSRKMIQNNKNISLLDGNYSSNNITAFTTVFTAPMEGSSTCYNHTTTTDNDDNHGSIESSTFNNNHNTISRPIPFTWKTTLQLLHESSSGSYVGSKDRGLVILVIKKGQKV